MGPGPKNPYPRAASSASLTDPATPSLSDDDTDGSQSAGRSDDDIAVRVFAL